MIFSGDSIKSLPYRDLILGRYVCYLFSPELRRGTFAYLLEELA